MQKQNLRHAEKSRVSSCKFADFISTFSKSNFNFLFSNPPPGLKIPEQTCVAALFYLKKKEKNHEKIEKNNEKIEKNNEKIEKNNEKIEKNTKKIEKNTKKIDLIIEKSEKNNENPDLSPCSEFSDLHLISLAFGTKLNFSGSPSSLADMHAEVLALKGAKKFLEIEMEKVEKGEKSEIFEINIENEGEKSENKDEKIFKKSKKILKKSITFHFFSSSMPCGNACVRQWAKSEKEKEKIIDLKNEKVNFQGEQVGVPTFSDFPHSPFLPSAVKEGQLAVLAKKNSLSSLEDFKEFNDEINLPKIRENLLPGGVENPNFSKKFLPSCSDFILLANIYGVQGRRIIEKVEKKLFLASMTVGRKFSRKHAERAFCCRMQYCVEKRKKRKAGWMEGEEGGGVFVNHPLILCSSVKFDEKVVDTSSSSQACFDSPLCGVGWREGGGIKVEWLDSRTGKQVEGEPSALVGEEEEGGGEVEELDKCVFGKGSCFEGMKARVEKFLI